MAVEPRTADAIFRWIDGVVAGASEVGGFELAAVKNGSFEGTAREIGSAEIRLAKVDLSKVAIGKDGFREGYFLKRAQVQLATLETLVEQEKKAMFKIQTNQFALSESDGLKGCIIDPSGTEVTTVEGTFRKLRMR